MRHKTSAAPNPIYGGINMVHQYQLNNYNIVLDTCSGSVHSVDDVAYDIISMYGQLIVPQTEALTMLSSGSKQVSCPRKAAGRSSLP